MSKMAKELDKRKWFTPKGIFIIVSLIVTVFAIIGIRTYSVYQKDLPSFEKLHNIEAALKTKIYSADGVLLQEYFNENRMLTPFKDMPPHLINMLIAVEDRKFYDHWGINPLRIVKALMVDIVSWRIAQGASTITQQLARMLFLSREQTIARKIKEAMTAIKLERNYSKQEIIQMYLNHYYFGKGAYGISAAARTYFDKRVDELSINECALLISLLKGPSRYSNKMFEDTTFAVNFRNNSLYAFYDFGQISRETYDSLKALPIELNPPVEIPGKAPYFTEIVRQYLLSKYGEKALYSDGLKVFSTLDWKIQQTAEEAIKEKLDSIQARIERSYGLTNPTYTYFLPDTVDTMGDSIRVYHKVQGACATINNENGNVMSLIGGYSFEETKYNRAVQSLLQPGSSFKPFVYTAAIDNGYQPTDILFDNSIKLEIPGTKDWRPHNFDNKFLGKMTLRRGLYMSRNLIAIKLLLKIHPEQAIFYAHKMGITANLKPVASLAIGTEEVRLIELVSAYTTFPNGGIKVPYRFITKIIDRYGNVIEDNTNIAKKEVLSERTAYIMVNMMQSVADAPQGTGRSMRWRGFTRPAGGKTGTSDNFCDNWFVGYTPQITSGVWIGFDEKRSLGRNQTGGRNALPIWTKIMIAAHDTLPIADFEVPDGIEFVNVCLESGKLATDRCVEIAEEVFRTENVPIETCPIHPSQGLYVSPDATDDRFIAPEDTTAEIIRF